tara:strand:- start:884 stop:1972 length:1089 start_codon:yes stop_codon:yes gene_type:complete
MPVHQHTKPEVFQLKNKVSLLKTPLRYPGGKSRACDKMNNFLPNLSLGSRYKQYREPFLGGGSFALHVTKKYPHLEIWVNDLYEPLANFWQQLRADGVEMRKRLVKLKNANKTQEKAKELFLKAKEDLYDKEATPLDRAVNFYIINKCSFSGLSESSSFSAQASKSNFSLAGIKRLDDYQELIKYWRITNKDYEELMYEGGDCFMYLDPPYDIKDNLYGKKGGMHKGFDHDRFAEICSRTCAHQLISYNSSELVKNRFATEWEAQEYDLTYTMRSTDTYKESQKERKELLLFNYERGMISQLRTRRNDGLASDIKTDKFRDNIGYGGQILRNTTKEIRNPLSGNFIDEMDTDGFTFINSEVE